MKHGQVETDPATVGATVVKYGETTLVGNWQKGMKFYYPDFFLGGGIVMSCKIEGIIILPSYKGIVICQYKDPY